MPDTFRPSTRISFLPEASARSPRPRRASTTGRVNRSMVKPLRIPGVSDEGIIQIPQVVVYRAAAGGAAHHMDAVGLHERPVDLALGVLILPDDDGVVILPQQQVVSRRPIPQDRLLKSQV